MSSMRLHRGTPGRHHRRPTPHFWRFAVDHRERKLRWARRVMLTPAEVRMIERAAAARRAALLGVVARPSEPVTAKDVSWRSVLAALLDQDEAAA